MTPARNLAIWIYSTLIGVTAGAVYAVAVAPLVDRTSRPSLVWAAVLVVGFALAEVYVVRLRFGPDAVGFSLMEIPLVLGLYFVRPDLLIAYRLGGALVAYLWQRKAPQKIAFNLALFGLETASAVAIWRAVVGSGDPLGPRGWLGTVAAATFTSVAGALLVVGVITIASGRRPGLRDNLGVGQLGDLANACFALVAVYIISVDWRAAWLLLVVTATLWVAHRSYDGARRRNESLEQVNRFTEVVGREIEVDSVVAQVLLGVRNAFPATVAELRLAPEGGGQEDWVVKGDRVEHGPAWLLGAMGQVAAEPTLLGPRNPGGAVLAELGLRDGLVVPLRSEGRIVGSLAVADKVGDAASFSSEDLRQLQALANHAAVAIGNALRADLIMLQADEREHLALHDELTGLPNRRLFTRMLTEAIARAGAAVLLLDLDNFRAVNDTLGHQFGDCLLRLVAERVCETVPKGGVVARLGSDEFAVLLPGAGDLDARAATSVVRSALTRPFDLDGLSVAIDPSVGVVVAGAGDEAASILRHADIALFSAQESRAGYVVFSPELDRSDSSRLGLLGDLRAAIAANDLEVHYQPQVDLATGVGCAVEALARWSHPEHGAISPEEFIPLAEHSGLITPLTLLVLRTALRDCERMRANGHALTVAVNISPRSLLDPGFVDEVARALAMVAVPASALTLEITETSLMADPERAVAALERLASVGVRLSVDDLGTGYSSLAYLLRLPVHELKIDRCFVTPLPDPAAEALVGAIIDLGHRLGHQVVVEGIEDEAAYNVVRDLGCDIAQGYWLGRPMSLEDVERHLAARRPQRAGLRSVL